MTNVIKSHIYGKQSHDIYTVLFNTDKEQPDSVNLTVPTLDDLSVALGDNFIPQAEIKQTLADFEHESGVSFSDSAKTDFAKEQVTKAITAYDSSSEVNEFSYMGFPLWLDKETRSGLVVRFNAEEAMGKTDTKLWAGTTGFSLSIADGRNMLNTIEYYASQCFDCTASHKASVEKLGTIDEVVTYDYRSGYPGKIEFMIA